MVIGYTTGEGSHGKKGVDRTRLQTFSLINDSSQSASWILTTNSVVVTDAIKYVQTNKEKLAMSTKEENEKESKEPDYDNGEDKNQLEGNKKRKQKIKK